MDQTEVMVRGRGRRGMYPLLHGVWKLNRWCNFLMVTGQVRGRVTAQPLALALLQPTCNLGM
jgi:hypothetical protein